MSKLVSKHLASVQQLSGKSTANKSINKLTSLANGIDSIQKISAASPSQKS